MDGAVVNLPKGRTATVASYNGLTAVDGNVHLVEFTIGDPGTATAGNYRDNIIVSVSAR